MGITRVNPYEFELLFERFLNSGRMGSWEDRPSFEIETDCGKKITLQEGDLVRIVREGRETVVGIEELQEGDDILRY